ncbi:hypothetical protein ACSV9I_08060 [Rhizobium sp. G187]|nr:hypothetical protein [Rhizobium sp. AAP43]
MQTNSSISPKTAAPATIPAHVLERLESEWRQVRQPSSPTGTPK